MLGPVLFGQAILLYLTLGLVLLAHVVLFRTRFGLALRAAGENPSAADAAGISVARMRYIGVLIGGATAGMAGAYLVLAQIGLFRESIVSGQGFIALGLSSLEDGIRGRRHWLLWCLALAMRCSFRCNWEERMFRRNCWRRCPTSSPYWRFRDCLGAKRYNRQR